VHHKTHLPSSDLPLSLTVKGIEANMYVTIATIRIWKGLGASRALFLSFSLTRLSQLPSHETWKPVVAKLHDLNSVLYLDFSILKVG